MAKGSGNKKSGTKSVAKSAALKGVTKTTGKTKVTCPHAALAQSYAGKVIGSKPWRWDGIKKGLNRSERKAVREAALKGKLIPKIPVDTNGFPAFPKKYIKDDNTSLPKNMWKNTSDSKQFTWLNNNLESKNPDYDAKTQTFRSDSDKKKYTWHHHQDNGRMQLVEFGIHNATNHNGGRTTWATGKR
jgi:A nuclease of the HNH/ENDO VII superfamily with conserved WHH